MFPRKSAQVLFLLGLLIASSVFADDSSTANHSGVQIIQGPDTLQVKINGELFTEYHFKDVPRPFWYPLIGPDELPMTRNWPMKNVPDEEHDHPHHRSFWFAHGSINGHDFWSEEKDFGRTVQDHFTEVKSGKNFGEIRSKNNWVTKEGSVVCTDDRTLRIYEPANPEE